MASSLVVANIDAGYGAVRVLEDVSLLVSPGETVALLGTNGNGKSTLMKSIMGIVQPVAGSIRATIDDVDAQIVERDERGPDRRGQDQEGDDDQAEHGQPMAHEAHQGPVAGGRQAGGVEGGGLLHGGQSSRMRGSATAQSRSARRLPTSTSSAENIKMPMTTG